MGIPPPPGVATDTLIVEMSYMRYDSAMHKRGDPGTYMDYLSNNYCL